MVRATGNTTMNRTRRFFLSGDALIMMQDACWENSPFLVEQLLCPCVNLCGIDEYSFKTRD